MLLNQSGIHLKKNHKQFMFFSMKHNKSYMLAVPLIRKEENTSIFTKKMQGTQIQHFTLLPVT